MVQIVGLSRKQQAHKKKQRLRLIFAVVALGGLAFTAMNHTWSMDTAPDFNPQHLQSPQNMKAIDIPRDQTSNIRPASKNKVDWCEQVAAARADLDPKLHISYPCKDMSPATSAIVCMLTDGGVPVGKETRIVFSSRDYLNGIVALGQSLQEHANLQDTHRLLLFREGLEIADHDRVRLEAVGWTLGTTPPLNLLPEYAPRFARYKTTYTKINAIGLSEYKCVMLMDADTLVVGNLDDSGLLSCKAFDDSDKYRVAGTIDYYHGQWLHFNTGMLVWRTSAAEMMRVYNLTRDPSFMVRFESDQIFLNHVFPDRTNVTVNQQIVTDQDKGDNHNLWGAVVALPWEYNAQTHVEVQLPDYWNEHLSDLKIIHFTEKKAWQCQERYEPLALAEIPSPAETKKCLIPLKKQPRAEICFCREAYQWWGSLKRAEERIAATISAAA